MRNLLFPVRETPEISRVRLDVSKGRTEKRYGQRVERKRNEERDKRRTSKESTGEGVVRRIAKVDPSRVWEFRDRGRGNSHNPFLK